MKIISPLYRLRAFVVASQESSPPAAWCVNRFTARSKSL